MPDFGPQSGYIYASYAIALLVISAMIVHSVARRAAARRRLSALEGNGKRA